VSTLISVCGLFVIVAALQDWGMVFHELAGGVFSEDVRPRRGKNVLRAARCGFSPRRVRNGFLPFLTGWRASLEGAGSEPDREITPDEATGDQSITAIRLTR